MIQTPHNPAEDDMVLRWLAKKPARGRPSCPCGFVGASRTIIDHRRNCDAWKYHVRNYERLTSVRSEPLIVTTPNADPVHPVVRCIDDTLAVLVARLDAKQPVYHPDAEWNAIMRTCEALRAAKLDIAQYVAPNEKVSDRC